MRVAKEQMQREGLWNENTTFEEISNYAGSHCCITESVIEDKENI